MIHCHWPSRYRDLTDCSASSEKNRVYGVKTAVAVIEPKLGDVFLRLERIDRTLNVTRAEERYSSILPVRWLFSFRSTAAQYVNRLW